MERAFKFLIVGLAIGAALTVAGAFAYASLQPSPPGGTIFLTGDSPKDEAIQIREIFSLDQIDVTALKGRDGVGVLYHGVPVLAFLKVHGVNDFDRLVLYADDYELSVGRVDITNETILVPYENSMRILGSNMPVNAWVKNIDRIVVIKDGHENSISVNGRRVSYGSMLDDGIDSMVYSRLGTGYATGGVEYHFESGYVATGISLKSLLYKEGYSSFGNVTIKGTSFNKAYTMHDIPETGLLVTRDNGMIKLASPDKNPQGWPVIETIEVS